MNVYSPLMHMGEKSRDAVVRMIDSMGQQPKVNAPEPATVTEVVE